MPRKALLILSSILIILASCSNENKPVEKKHTQALIHILFIGNSYTFYNGGVNKQLERLASSIETSMTAPGGFTLESHWNRGEAIKNIRKSKWGYVVLQEQSQIPVFNQGNFFKFVKEFDDEIRNSGAKTVLFMTWERPDSVVYGVTTENLAKAYNEIGRQLNLIVAPVGIAFSRSLQSRPDIPLYSQDGHPTIYGTYLAACVLYGTILEHSPVGNPYADTEIKSETRKYLQQIAAETLGYKR